MVSPQGRRGRQDSREYRGDVDQAAWGQAISCRPSALAEIAEPRHGWTGLNSREEPHETHRRHDLPTRVPGGAHAGIRARRRCQASRRTDSIQSRLAWRRGSAGGDCKAPKAVRWSAKKRTSAPPVIDGPKNIHGRGTKGCPGRDQKLLAMVKVRRLPPMFRPKEFS
jgi:hypothetical protein